AQNSDLFGHVESFLRLIDRECGIVQYTDFLGCRIARFGDVQAAFGWGIARNRPAVFVVWMVSG
ncbi:hypothetical protein, partial [Pseudomonas protegens]|uniref:hypothetical protein n=1 Tax=Pseudomonas protegens TaxID=380021 RepID=UPI0022802767